MDRTQRNGILLVLMAAAGYAFMPILAKSAYAAGLQAFDVVTWRFMFATPCIWLVLRVFPRRPVLPGTPPLPRLELLLLGSFFALVALMAFWSLERIPASTFIFLVYSWPMFVALLSWFVGERLPAQGWVALAITLTGIALVMPDFTGGLVDGDPLGVALALLNGLMSAVYLVAINRLLRGHQRLARASAYSITGTLITLLALALINGLAVPREPAAWLSVIGIGIISTVVPIFGMLAGMRRLGAPQAAITSTLEPLLVLIFSFLLLGESMLPVQLLGGALIVSGPLILHIRRRRRLAEPAGVV